MKGGASTMSTINLIKPRLSSSVNISIEALVKAVGLRPNCVEVINNKVTYINEYNAFGNGNTLNRNALLVYMYLHFLDVNSEAHCVLDLYQAHKYLDLPERTILNNLRILSRKDYICFCPGTLDGTYDIFINYYTTKALPANAGGKGFIVLSKILLDKLKKLPGINELRFTVRGLMNKVPGKQNMKLSDGCNMSKLKTMFPTYTQVKDIIKVMSNDIINSIFKISQSESSKYFKIRLLETYDAYAEKRKQFAKAEKQIRDYFDILNSEFAPKSVTINPTDRQFKDMSKIASTNNIDNIKLAIKQIYTNFDFIAPIRNLPGLVRVKARELQT